MYGFVNSLLKFLFHSRLLGLFDRWVVVSLMLIKIIWIEKIHGKKAGDKEVA